MSFTASEIEARRAHGREGADAALRDSDAEWVWWWLSFANPRAPKGQQFLGVAIIDCSATDDELVEGVFLQSLLEKFGHVLEMVQNFVVYASFGVAGIVAGKSVAATSPGKRVEKSFVFLDFIEMQIEEAGPVAIHKSYP